VSRGREAAEAVVGLLARRRWAALGALLVLCGLATWAAVDAMAGDPKNLFDNRVEIWFLDEDPTLLAYREFQAAFGNDEAVLIAVSAPEGETVFTAETLDLIADLSARLKTVDHVHGVTSLATVLHIGLTGDGAIEIAPFYGAEGLDAARAAEVEATLRADPLYGDALVSDDGRTTLITVQLDPVAPGEAQHSILGAVAGLFAGDEAEAPAASPTPGPDGADGEDDLIALFDDAAADDPVPSPGPDAIADIDAKRGEILAALEAEVEGALEAAGRDAEGAWAWGGVGVINEALNEVSQRDLVVFSTITFWVLVLCLWLSLRRLWAVIVAVTIVEVASLLLTGLYLGLGFKFNLVTMILTTLVLVIGVTDSIYFITTYFQQREELEAKGLSKREAVVKAVGFCFLPGFINSLTTSIAFLAFASAKMAVIRHLGVFAGAGIVIAFLSTVVVTTAAFDLLDVRPPPAAGRGGRFLAPFLARLSELARRRRRPILAVGVGIFLAAGGGILQLDVDTYTLGYFYDDHPVRKADRFIEERFGPYMPLEVVVDAGEPDGILDPAVLQRMDALEREVVAGEPKIAGAVSLAGVVKRLNQVFHEGSAEHHAVPDDPELVAQELFFYDPTREDDPLQLVDFPSYRRGRITFRTSNDSAGEARRVIERIVAAADLPEGNEVVPSGYVPLYVRLIDYLVEGQVISITLTFGLVFVLIGVLFRSLRYALISVVPNAIPVAATMGFMGYAGIDLDVATVLIAAVALGIAVDDTIHLLYKFKAAYEETGDPEDAVDQAVRMTGVPIVTTSLVLTAGFAVLCLANVKSMALFGLLIGVTMISALVAELVVTPAVLLTFGPPKREVVQGPVDSEPRA